jgi:hypothetical protein
LHERDAGKDSQKGRERVGFVVHGEFFSYYCCNSQDVNRSMLDYRDVKKMCEARRTYRIETPGSNAVSWKI